MKKNRNSFFTEANMSYSGYNPNVPNMMQGAVPYQAQTSYNSFYSGPNNMQGAVPYPKQYMGSDNIENRLAKIERQINRLEHRINKLESTNTTYITEEIDTSGNMYML